MKYTRETLKQKYKSGEISISEYRALLYELDKKERDEREKLLASLESDGKGESHEA